jgi:hypothetical protein
VLQVPEGVSEASGTFDDGSGPAPLLVTQTGSFAVEPGVDVTAEDGRTFLILELPGDVAAGLPEVAPEDGTPIDYTFTFKLPGDLPLDVKGMLTLRLDVAGQTFYVPMLPCTTDFATIPAVQIPAPVTDYDVLPAIAAALDQSLACSTEVRDYSSLDLDLDHRLLYKVAPAAGQDAEVMLTDALGSAGFDVQKTALLGTPADRDLLDPGAPAEPEHLMGYKVKPLPGTPKAAKRRLRTANRLGLQTVELTKSDLLLVPAAKSLVGPATPLVDPELDAFACSRARAVKGEPGLAKGTTASVTDQLGSGVYELGKPSRLCRPVDVDGESPGDEDHPGQLLCFKAKRAPKVCQGAPTQACRKDADCAGPCVAQAKFAARPGVNVADRFGAQAFAAAKPLELCVPSTSGPAPKARARAASGPSRRGKPVPCGGKF